MDRDTARAVDAVKARLRELGWTQAKLAREAQSDPNTISDFINGVRWPRPVTRERIEKALGWSSGYIDELATIGERGANVTQPIRQTDESPSASGDQPLVLAGWPPGTFEGMTDIEREEWIARTKAAGLQIARELREGKQQ